MKNVIGRLHSIESFGAVDGPGVRFIAFLQGCPLRCLYCHNPDTWEHSGGKEITSADLVKEICGYKSFISSGGVTLSGGEPLLQAEFCEAVIDGCHEEGLHVALDTSGCIPLEKSEAAIRKADMLLLDIKDIFPEDCKVLTGMTNENALRTLNFCEETGKPVWIRHVLLPQYTLKDEKLHEIGQLLKKYSCVEKIELLPYHTMGKFKWAELGIQSKINGVEPPNKDEVEHAREILREYGLPVA